MSREKAKPEKKKSRCQVRNCTRNPYASIHQLPKNMSVVREKWIESLQLGPDFHHTFFVCGEHFVEKDFEEGKMRKRLRRIAVPSVNLPSIKRQSKVKKKVKNTIVSKSVDEKLLLESSDKLLLESPVEEILGI